MVEPLSFFLFELLALALLLLCLVGALRQRRLPLRSAVLELGVFILYGLSLESVAVAAGFYSYAPFALSVWHTPLVIGLSWGVIGVSVMGFSDSLNMVQWAKPFLDALLALLIDLGMDAVAIRDRHLFEGELLGMWQWDLAPDEQWFGVPYANFMAWWLIIFIMSACLRAGRYLYAWYAKDWLAWAYPLLGFALALSLFLLLLFTIAVTFHVLILLLVLALSILVSVLSIQGRQYQLSWRHDLPVLLVPLAFHLFFLLLLLWRKLYLDNPAILVVSLVVLLLNEAIVLLALHRRRDAIL